MEMKWIALVAASAVASAAFVGCSCGNKVDNSMDNMNQIEVQSDVMLSSAETSSVTTTAVTTASTDTNTTTSDTTTSSVTDEGTTTVSKAIQFVGQPQAKKTTAKPTVVTQIVVVTVTRAPASSTAAPVTTTTVTTTETTVAETTTTALVTTLMPDGLFHGDADLKFSVETAQMSVGNVMPDLGTAVINKTETAAVNGGFAAYVYSCEGFTVTSEMYMYDDGTVHELIKDIALTGANVCTAKGITVGSSIDDIITAYGTEGLEITETLNYRYKTEDGRVLDICTDGSSVREIKYCTEVQ